MASVNTANLDEVFKYLRENKPITSDLIKKSSADYENIKVVLRNVEEKKTDGQKPDPGSDVYKCPLCQKDIPYPAPPTNKNQEEIDRLTQELDARTRQCQQMEQHIATQDQKMAKLRQTSGHRSPGPPPARVVDPGDPNRAQQVGEQYEDLYDTEWTGAFKFLDNTMNLREDKVLDTLLRILRAAYSFCDDIARAQMMNMEGELYCPLSTWTEDARVDFIGRKTTFPQKSARIAHTYRKSTSAECVPAIQNAFIAQILPEFMDPTLYNNRHVLSYVKRCVEITWYMVIQETPMVLISKVNRKSQFDRNLFRYYSNQGDKFDFVVWPALLMYTEGPIIIKGFAYALDPNRSIPNVRETEMETNRIPPKGKENMVGSELNQGLAGGTPWGSNYFSNAGTPSVDLPPLPLENVSPTRVSPGRASREEQRQLTAAWKGKEKPTARP
ncbi:uncharacterized protein LOC110441640 [Mizuhopecten yessoensis]|uniref:Mitochondria-eating protein C-terminal domain-containing protein n=1 Tax=Mizuhopecten yessoensis TaxID=6573 RepID=A0A210PJ09_MIZYE|nr:uncharacterized protein LOC110441640 [Mizuhopecten yessoensis]OWF36478.1 hypothetical protein KP79_PYT03163 [Mizuhopecten yessoensis]